MKVPLKPGQLMDKFNARMANKNMTPGTKNGTKLKGKMSMKQGGKKSVSVKVPKGKKK